MFRGIWEVVETETEKSKVAKTEKKEKKEEAGKK